MQLHFNILLWVNSTILAALFNMQKILFTIFIFYANSIVAQTYNAEAISPKAKKQYAKAMNLIADGFLNDGIIELNKTIEIDNNYADAVLSLAGVYGEKKDYANAVKYYNQAFAIDTAYTQIYKLPYAINLCGIGKFEDALKELNQFLAIENLTERSLQSALYRKKNCEFAIDYQQKHINDKYEFAPINLGDSVNTVRSEYYPTLTISDSLLVFTRMSNTGENFIKSTITNNHYTQAEVVEGSINRQALKGAATVSSDGEYLIFAGDFFEKGFGSYDLYISYNTPDGWSEPENLGPNVNSPYWESAPSISPDSRTLYFSSDRPGGYGGRDLYMCTKQSNGKWSKPINLGSTINTKGNDLYPYIHADNQTLYYTSDGLPGYGNTDLYVSRKIGTTDWTTPQNLGFPVNTIEDEGSIAISSDATTAYIASDRADSRGGLDLYKFELRDDIKPYKTLYVKGTVIDALSNVGIPCNVELIDNSTNKLLMKVTADELGKYFIPLPTGKDYTFIVNRKGYLYFSQQFELSTHKADSTYTINIALQPIQLNAATTFKNVQFETNSYKLLPISLVELDKLIQILTDNPTIKLEIIGHTDNVGKSDDNTKLSTNRAKAVVDYLVSKDIAAARLQYKGLGASKPIATNDTEGGRFINRRTEFVIIGL